MKEICKFCDADLMRIQEDIHLINMKVADLYRKLNEFINEEVSMHKQIEEVLNSGGW